MHQLRCLSRPFQIVSIALVLDLVNPGRSSRWHLARARRSGLDELDKRLRVLAGDRRTNLLNSSHTARVLACYGSSIKPAAIEVRPNLLVHAGFPYLDTRTFRDVRCAVAIGEKRTFFNEGDLRVRALAFQGRFSSPAWLNASITRRRLRSM